jgi:hypothetical protein
MPLFNHDDNVSVLQIDDEIVKEENKDCNDDDDDEYAY